jgi:hypothetical protein
MKGLHLGNRCRTGQRDHHGLLIDGQFVCAACFRPPLSSAARLWRHVPQGNTLWEGIEALLMSTSFTRGLDVSHICGEVKAGVCICERVDCVFNLMKQYVRRYQNHVTGRPLTAAWRIPKGERYVTPPEYVSVLLQCVCIEGAVLDCTGAKYDPLADTLRAASMVSSVTCNDINSRYVDTLVSSTATC